LDCSTVFFAYRAQEARLSKNI